MAKLAGSATRQSAGVCFRLKKTCQPSDSVRRRDLQTAEESDARIARLEDKMESLLNVMQSFIGSLGPSEFPVNILQPLRPLNGESISSSTTYTNGTSINTPGANVGFSEGPTSAMDLIATVPPNLTPSYLSHNSTLSISASSPNPADERLNFFRYRMLPYFPFIDLTPGMTSSYLRRNRPVLFQAIHTVTTFSTQERLAQVEELKHLLFTSTLLKVQSNIDLLLGSLTYLAWSTDAFLGKADLMSRLLMLAISLVYDMRLFKPPSQDVQLMMTITQGRNDENSHSLNDETPDALLEKQRAILACFILSSKCA
ncbi:uncharacterized protein N7503_001066 [Penicillium pulvis]|uniref:uncharacterized protein n=1 Tax=Penicillium pulvis TaxID=1562058 RepID=UPI002546F76C|nr:uncharacterized protein N7503_001066 [Penicillium pulvis]KAJ5814316.1 hypothetical protein N7503_001066 [Penicillium pulvis]